MWNKGVGLHVEHYYQLFRQDNIGLVRSCLKLHEIDVNACTIHVGNHAYTSPAVYAVIQFDRRMMECLLSEFEADLNAHCYRESGSEKTEYLLDYALCGPDSVSKGLEATAFLLDHGASPFLVSTIDDPQHARLVPDALALVKTARDRLYTAWAAHWALSQHLVFRDMAQQVAQCILATPVREFLATQEDLRKKSKVSK